MVLARRKSTYVWLSLDILIQKIWVLTLDFKLLSSKFQLFNGKDSAHDTLKY